MTERRLPQYSGRLTPEQVAGKVHVRFPGLFANAWLYVNGRMIAYRPQADMFWENSDYTFSWDVDLTGALKPGRNGIAGTRTTKPRAACSQSAIGFGPDARCGR